MNILQQLKQRRLFRVVFGYFAAGWLVLQVIDQVTQQGILPGFAYDLTLTWYLAGIPIALIIGWYHGEKGAQHVVRREVVLLILFACVGVGASVPIVSKEVRRRMRMDAATQNKLDLRNVAVLYFEDRSPGDSLAYLADGFTESLMNELATVPALHVVSRNGVARYRGSDVAPDSIARALNAGTLVDGTVDKEGGRIRISVSLIDGQSGAEFEHTSFQKPSRELLAARDELANQTSRLLRQWLGQEVELSRTRDQTQSVPAWALYQRADRQLKNARAVRSGQKADTAALADLGEADSLAARAALVDSSWAGPDVLRAQIAYTRARLTAVSGDFPGAVPWIQKGLGYAASALQIDNNEPRAIEWRGRLNYLHWELHLVPEAAQQDSLLAGARRDLEKAVNLDPQLAGAFAALSEIYLNMDDYASTVLAARRAYEADAYLQDAGSIVARIFWGSYNLGQFPQAKHWCDIGGQRFPDESIFATCQLVLMTTPAEQPEPARAAELVARVDSLAPPQKAYAERNHVLAEIMFGGVLARAGLADSARSVLIRAREAATPQIDPRMLLHLYEGYMRMLVGDTAETLDQVQAWAAANPGQDFSAGWMWQGLRGNPKFEQIRTQALGTKAATEGGSG